MSDGERVNVHPAGSLSRTIPGAGIVQGEEDYDHDCQQYPIHAKDEKSMSIEVGDQPPNG
jgi:hypothetical protein